MLFFKEPQPPVKEIDQILEQSETVLVASHLDPDGDALGSQLAFASYLKDLGKKVVLVRDGDIPEKYRFLDGITDIPQFEELDKTLSIDTAVILECPTPDRIGKAKTLLNENIKIINIDHHRDNDGFGYLNWFNINASSVGEMVFEYFEKKNYNLTREIAECLFVAIMTDTGRFRYRSTSGRTMEIAGKLIDAGVDPQKSCDLVYYDMKPSSMKLIGKVLNNICFKMDNRYCYITMDNKTLKETGADYSESDGLVDYTLFNRGVIVGAFIKENENGEIKVSLRSKDGINVAAIASEFGGGGHFNAAGFTLKTSLDEAVDLISNKICEVINAEKSIDEKIQK